jgi:hypothetical protein
VNGQKTKTAITPHRTLFLDRLEIGRCLRFGSAIVADRSESISRDVYIERLTKDAETTFETESRVRSINVCPVDR